MKKRIIALIILSVFLVQISGCAGIQNDGDRTRAEGAAVGAGGGAALGALIGQIFGGNTKATLFGAAIGAVVGLISGYLYGDHVAKQKERYAKEEDWLDDCLISARDVNEQIFSYNELLQQDIKYVKQQIENIEGTFTDMKIRREKMLAVQTEVDNQLKVAEETLNIARTEVEVQETVVSDARLSGQSDYADNLDLEIEKLQANIKALEARTEELASLSANMAV